MGSTRLMWVRLDWVGLMRWVGLGWIEFFLTHHGGHWVGSKNPLNPTQPNQCTPLINIGCVKTSHFLVFYKLKYKHAKVRSKFQGKLQAKKIKIKNLVNVNDG